MYLTHVSKQIWEYIIKDNFWILKMHDSVFNNRYWGNPLVYLEDQYFTSLSPVISKIWYFNFKRNIFKIKLLI